MKVLVSPDGSFRKCTFDIGRESTGRLRLGRPAAETGENGFEDRQSMQHLFRPDQQVRRSALAMLDQREFVMRGYWNGEAHLLPDHVALPLRSRQRRQPRCSPS